MKNMIALFAILFSANVFAQPNCSKEAATLAADEYANDNFGDHASTSVKPITAKDGSVYYDVKATGTSGSTTYVVIFDDPSSCATDTARVYQKKK